MKVSKPVLAALPLALILGLAGCGGGGGSDSTSHVAAGVTTSTGVVVDFYLSGSKVTFANATCAPTTTNGRGEFTIPAATCGAITVTEGTDVVTGLPFKGRFTAPAGSTVVSPVTTVIQAMIDSGKLPAQAQAAVMAVLGLTMDPTTTDPMKDPDALAHTMALVQVSQHLTEAFSRTLGTMSLKFEDIYANVLKNVAKSLPASGTVDMDAAFVTAIAEATAREMAPGRAAAANAAKGIGPAVSAIARAAADQIKAIKPELTATKGDAVKALALVMTGSDVDDNVKALTGLAASISTELARNDLATSEPAAVAQQITAAIGVGRVKPPVLTKGS